MNYERPSIRRMEGYTFGEQPAQTHVIKLNTNENPYPATAAVAAVLSTLRVEDLRRYPQPYANGFRDAAAQFHGVGRDNIMATNGGDELLRLAITTFVDPGQILGMAEPGYSLYPVLAAVQGCKVARIPLKDDWSLPQDFASRLNAEGAKLAFVINPHAPSGKIMPVAQLRQLAAEFKGVLVIDEAYANFVDPELAHNAVPLIHEFDNVMLLRTLSKGYSLAGLRFAYAIAPASLLEPMLHKTRDSYNTDFLSQRLAQAAIESSDQAAHSWALVRSERARLTDALGELGFAVMSSQSNFVLASVPAQGTAAENDQLALRLYQQLKEDGILVRYFDQARLRDKLRITVGTEAQNSRLLDCLAHYLQAQKL